jgi:hypothetical protein
VAGGDAAGLFPIAFCNLIFNMRGLDSPTPQSSTLLGQHDTDVAKKPALPSDDRPLRVDAFMDHARPLKASLAVLLILGWIANVVAVTDLTWKPEPGALQSIQVVCDGVGLALKVSPFQRAHHFSVPQDLRQTDLPAT